jgi:glycosyltransferase involved in cell wall biosynthesis
MRGTKMTEPLVSVIMPTYNHGHFIRDSITSVLKQSYGNIELIIIDNYSDDNTEEVVRSFGSSRTRYLKFYNNGIIAASRNIGLSQAKGSFVAFIDSDDTWHYDKIKKQMEYSEKHPEVALIACDLEIHGKNCKKKRTLLKGIKREKKGFLYNTIIFKNLISCSSAMVRSDIFKHVGVFDENPDMVSVEDWDLWLRIAHSYPICIMPVVLGGYNLHQNNISKKSDMLNKMIGVIEKNIQKGWLTRRKTILLKLLVTMRKIRSFVL